MSEKRPCGPQTDSTERCVINSSFSQFRCLSGIPVVRCSFIILPLMTTCYQSQKSFLTLSCLIMGRSSFRSSTMSNCLGPAWGACDKWRLTNEDFEVSRLKAINNKPDNLCKQDGGEAPMWSTQGEKKNPKKTGCPHVETVLAHV